MIDALIRWCLKNAFIIVLGVGAIGGVGYFALLNTRVDAIPDIGEKQVIVYADAGALPAAGLQQLIDGVRGLDMDKVRAEIAAEDQQA